MTALENNWKLNLIYCVHWPYNQYAIERFVKSNKTITHKQGNKRICIKRSLYLVKMAPLYAFKWTLPASINILYIKVNVSFIHNGVERLSQKES
jgi:hypothetical protein